MVEQAGLEKEVITAEQVLAGLGPRATLHLDRLTATQRAGGWFAAGVGSTGAVVILMLLISWAATLPGPELAMGLGGDQLRAVENFQGIRKAHTDNYLSIIDAVVVKALLPVFTL